MSFSIKLKDRVNTKGEKVWGKEREFETGAQLEQFFVTSGGQIEPITVEMQNTGWSLEAYLRRDKKHEARRSNNTKKKHLKKQNEEQ